MTIRCSGSGREALKMNRSSRNSILCPSCRKLISEDEPICPFCGLQTPGSRWKNNPLTRGWGSGDKLIRIVIYTNIGMYLLSWLLHPRLTGGGFNPLRLFSPDQNSLAVLGATGTLLMNYGNGWWTLLSANYLARVDSAYLLQYDGTLSNRSAHCANLRRLPLFSLSIR